MQTAPFRAFLLSFAVGLTALFSGHSLVVRLTDQPPEPPLQVPLKVPQPPVA